MVRDDQPVAWLLGGDRAIRWQVMQDLFDAPPEAVDSAPLEMASKGWVRSRQDPEGPWAGGLHHLDVSVSPPTSSSVTGRPGSVGVAKGLTNGRE
jgi:hypothetical protein